MEILGQWLMLLGAGAIMSGLCTASGVRFRHRATKIRVAAPYVFVGFGLLLLGLLLRA